MIITYKNSTPKKVGYQQIYEMALEMFGHDRNKTNSWWLTKQNSLGNKSPYESARDGNARKLMKIIERCIL